LKWLVHQRIGNVIGVVRHHLLRDAQNDFQDLSFGEPCIQERLNFTVIDGATVSNNAQRERTQGFQPSARQRSFGA